MLGMVTEAVGLHDQKSIAIRNFEAALRSGSGKPVSMSIQKRIAKVLKLADENAQYLLAMKHSVNRIIHRVNTLDENTHVGAYGADGRKLSFSQTAVRPSTYLRKV